MQFATKNSPQFYVDIAYANKLIYKAHNTKFLGIYLDSTLAWKIHIEQITDKLIAVCCAVRSVKLKVVYYAFFSFHYELWISILGTLHIVQNCLKYKKI